MDENKLFAKCARRLIPFIFLLYLVNYIDRVNVGFAALTMNRDVGLSPSVFGFGAGIFFLGYLIFQVPANLILEKVGARRWVFWMLGVWGIVSASNALIRDPYSYYALRLFLGVAEAGFFPGMLLYMTFWFPNAWRGRFIAGFMAAIPMANIVGAPLSTSILEMDGIWGLHGWQWMFILEGLPASLLGFAAFKWLPDGPASTPWLNAEEKSIIAARLASEDRSEHRDFWPALTDPRVYAIGLVLLGNQVALYGIQLWMPQIVQSMGFSNFATGFVVPMPFLIGMAAMILFARSSDRTGERIWHTAAALMLAAFGLVVAAMAQSYEVMLAALTISLAGTLAYNGPFFSLPATFLAGTAAAGGIGFVNSIGSLGRFVGPWLVGVLKESSGDYSSGMAAMACAMLLSTVVVIVLGRMIGARKARLQPKPRQG
jgi:ACS family tartrate transporter-like MFS transporter